VAGNKKPEGPMSQWKLIHIDTGKPVNIGDELVTFRGEKVRLTGLQPPHKPEAQGRVFCEHDQCDNVWYASVVNCRYVRE
jgi:hypothetical protein